MRGFKPYKGKSKCLILKNKILKNKLSFKPYKGKSKYSKKMIKVYVGLSFKPYKGKSKSKVILFSIVLF